MNYLNSYQLLISKALARKEVAGYFELHHIIPKSMGGSDKNENLVKLTAREHFVAHLLLAKTYGGNMWYAAHLMLRVAKGRYSRVFEMIRREQALAKKEFCENNPDYIQFCRELQLKVHEDNPHLRDEARDRAYAMWADPEYQKLKSLGRKNWIQNNPEKVQEMYLKRCITMQTEDYKNLRSQIQKKRLEDPNLYKKTVDHLSTYVKSHRLEIAKRTKIQFQDPEKRQTHKTATIAAMADPKLRKYISEKAKERYADPLNSPQWQGPVRGTSIKNERDQIILIRHQDMIDQGFNPGSINRVLRGERKTYKDRTWERLPKTAIKNFEN